MTGTFHDLPEYPPTQPADEQPLRVPLPAPPFAWIGGVQCLVERIRIEDLEQWKKARGLVLVRGTYLGRYGRANVYWPQDVRDGGRE